MASYKVFSSGRSVDCDLKSTLFAAIVDASRPGSDRRVDVRVVTALLVFNIKEASVDRIDLCREFNGRVAVRFTILVEFEAGDSTVYRLDSVKFFEQDRRLLIVVRVREEDPSAIYTEVNGGGAALRSVVVTGAGARGFIVDELHHVICTESLMCKLVSFSAFRCVGGKGKGQSLL